MRTELAERAAELRQQELVAEVVKPAEAEAERVRILAVADAEKMKIQAEAAASHGRVALDKALIDQLPEIVEKAARGLANANLTVLNGAEGLTEVASGLVAQGRAIFDALRGTHRLYDDESAPPITTNRLDRQLRAEDRKPLRHATKQRSGSIEFDGRMPFAEEAPRTAIAHHGAASPAVLNTGTPSGAGTH